LVVFDGNITYCFEAQNTAVCPLHRGKEQAVDVSMLSVCFHSSTL